jgi:glycosyltransferase involved in cell wall biosynthesis
MQHRKKLLIVPGYGIYPLSLGSSVAQHGMIDHLRRDFDVSLFVAPNNVPAKRLPELEAAWPDVRFFTWGYGATLSSRRPPLLRRWFYRARNRYRKWAGRGRKPESKDLENILFTLSLVTATPPATKAARLAQVVDENDFDLVQFDLPDNIGLVHALGPTGAKKVFVHHEIKCERVRTHMVARGLDTPNVRCFHGCLQAVETGHLNAYDAVIVLTEADRHRLTDRLRITPPVHVSPFAVPHAFDLGVNRSAEDYRTDRLLFLGPSQHFPNFDGVEWLMETVYPKVYPRLQRPWCIVGRWNLEDDAVRRWAALPGVTFTGFVDDLAPYFQNSLMLAPIRIGGGIKTKILQGMVNGVPVIGHPFSFEGIDPVDGESAVERETPEGYAEAVLDLAANPRKAFDIGSAGRRLMKEQFTIDRVGAVRTQVIERILEAEST